MSDVRSRKSDTHCGFPGEYRNPVIFALHLPSAKANEDAVSRKNTICEALAEHLLELNI